MEVIGSMRARHWLLTLLLSLPAFGLAGSALYFRSDQPLSQALLGLLLAYLTGVLVAVTAFYAWTTERLRQMQEQDLQERRRVDVFVRLVFVRTGLAGEGAVHLQVANLSSAGIWLESFGVVAEPMAGQVSNPLPVTIEEVVKPYQPWTRDVTSTIRHAVESMPGQLKTPAKMTVMTRVLVHYWARGEILTQRTGRYRVDLGPISAHVLQLVGD